MVAVISGNGLGLLGTSASSLGMTTGGQAGLGQSGASQYVNVATGNLIVADTDERLIAQGLMAGLVRTYNSLGSNGDLGSGGWLLGLDRRVGDLTGTLNAAGSSITRDGGDGETQVFAYDGTRGLYVAAEKDGASDTLQWNAADGSWNHTAGGSLREETYDASGALRSLRDGKTGASYSLGYNAGGQLESVTAGDGEALLLQYDTAGRVSSLSTLEIPADGGDAQTVSRVGYHYDTLGRLDMISTDLTPADGSDAQTFTTAYGYDGSSSRLASLIQSDGVTVSYSYSLDSQGTYRIASVTLGSGADSQTQSFAYDLAARTTTVTDAGGRAWTYGYDAQGNLSSVTSPAVNGQREITRYTYTADGHLGSVTDPMGRVTTYEYDAHGNRTLERDPLGNTVSYTYSSSDQLLTHTVYRLPDPDGAGAAQPTDASTTRYVYDTSNRLRYVVDPDGDVQETQYNDQGLVWFTRGYADAVFDTSSLAVDAAPDLASMDSWSAAQDLTRTTRTDYAYDAAGRLINETQWSVVDGAGEGMPAPSEILTRFVYDAQGLLRLQLTGSGVVRAVSYSYDGLGRLLGRTDNLGTTAYTYLDGQGTLTVTQECTGLVRTEVRNSAGELAAVTTSASGETARKTHCVYDAGGQLRAVQDAGGAVSYRFYDAAGRLAGTVDATGTVTHYQRGVDGRTVATTQYATRIDTTAWFGAGDANGIPVDLDGVLPAADAGDRTDLSLYDASGRLAAEVDAGGYATTFVYDGAGNLTATTAHAVALSTAQRLSLQAAPDPASLQGDLIASADDRISYAFHDLANRVVATLDASGFVTTTAYDTAGRVTRTVAYATGLTAAQRAALGDAPTLAGVLNVLPSDPDDQVTRSYYDAQGEVVAQIDAGGYLTTLFHNERIHTRGSTRYATALAAAQLAGLTGHEDQATLVGYLSGSSSQTHFRHYTADGRLQSETAADGTVTVYNYNDAGQLTGTLATPPSGGQVRSTGASHDAFGDLLSATDGADATTTYTYNVRGQRVLTTDALGNKTWNVYDPTSGRLVYTVSGISSGGTPNALGDVTHFQYDAFGEAVQTTRLAARLDLVALGMDTATTPAALDVAVAAMADPDHDATTFTDYTHRGQVAERRDALGYATAISYDAFGDMVRTQHQVTQPGQPLSASNSVTTTYRYDARGQQTGRTDDAGALGRSTSTQYDAFGLITRQLDGLGHAVSYTYDPLGRQVSASQTVQGATRTTHTSYDAYGRVLTRTDAMGQVTTYGYSPDTHTLTVTAPDGVVVTTVTDAYGDTLSVTDGAGETSTYRYDGDGRLLESTDALGQTRHNDYNALGQLTRSTDASGRVVSHTYDALGRTLTRTVNPDGLAQTTICAYDGRGQQVSVTDAQGIVSTFAYDADGHLLTQVEDAGDDSHLNLTTTYAWNGAGEQLTVTEGAGTPEARTTQYVYDNLGRRTQQIVDPTGLALTTDYAYDSNDHLVAVTDPNRAITRYVYDEAGEQVYTIDPAGGVVQSFYDADGRVTATRRYATPIDTASVGTRPGLDQIAGKVTFSSADQRRYTVYDAAGRVHYTVDPLGIITEQRYDAAGRLAETIAYAKAVSNQAFDNAGMWGSLVAGTADADMAALIAAAGNTEANAQATLNLYDEDGRIRFVVQQNTVDGQRVGVVHERRYDAAGRVTDQLAYGTHLSLSAGSLPSQLSISSVAQTLAGTAAHRTRYVREGAGQVRYTIDAGGYVSEQQYDANGRVVQALTYLNAITVPASLSEASVAAAVSARNTGASTRTTTTTYDHAGRIHATGDALGINATCTYDATGLKTSFTNRDGATWTYTYDTAGRLLTETSPPVTVGIFGGTASVSTVNAGLVTRYTYDANGNVLSRTEAGGTSAARTIAYRYDALGHQVRTIYPDAGYVDSAGTWHASSAVGSTYAQVTYDTLGHAVVNRDVGGHLSYKTYDARGHVTAEVDANGYVSTYRYDAYGNQIAVTRCATALNTGAIGDWTPGQPLSAAQLAQGLTSSSLDRTLATAYDQRNQKTQVTQDAIAYRLAQGINAGQSGQGSPTTTYAYDAYGNLVRTAVKVQEASNGDSAWWAVTSSYYDADNRKVMDVDPMGFVTTYVYDGAGELTQSTEFARALGSNANPDSPTQPALPPAGDAASGFDRTTVIAYDALGRKASVTLKGHFGYVNGAAGLAAASRVTTYQYDGEDRLTHVTSDGATTVSAYDALGRVTKVTEPLRDVLKADWQSQLEGSIAVDLSSASLYTQVSPTTTITYDALGNAIRTTRAGVTLSQSTYAHYDVLGRQVISVDARGTSTFSGYDAAGNLTTSWFTLTGNDGASTVTTIAAYDSAGQRTSSVTTRSAGGTSTTEAAQYAKYNAFGEITDKGSSTSYSSHFQYDSAGRMVSGTDPKTGVTHTYAYSLAGAQLADTWVLDDSGHTATLAWQLDLDDRHLAVIQPSDSVSTGQNPAGVHYAYDRWGNVLSTTNALGDLTSYQYDSNDKLYKEIEPQVLVVGTDGHRATASPVKYWYYDTQGRLAGARDENGHASWNTFDATGNLVMSQDAAGAKTYLAYDSLGRVRARQTPPAVTASGTAVHITWSDYNGNDQVTSQGDFLGKADRSGRLSKTQQTYALNTAGDRIGVTDALGHTAYYDYDSQHHVIRSQSAVQHASGWSETFNYDLNGNKVHTITADGDSESWLYDDFGRRQSHNDLSGALITYAYDSHTGWLSSEATLWSAHTGQSHAQVDPAYLGSSQTTGLGTVTYTYYADGQIKQVTKAVAGSTVQSTSTSYDAAGQTTRTVTDTRDGTGAPVHDDTRTEYDSHGRISLVTASNASQGLVRTATVYDAAGNRRAVFVQSGLGPDAAPIDTAHSAPTASTIPVQTAEPAQAWTFDASAYLTDPLAFGLTWTAALSDGSALPGWLHFSAGTFSGTPAAAGNWSIKLTATDVEGHSANTTFQVSVPVATPVFSGTLSAPIAHIGDALSFSAPAATDANGAALTYTAEYDNGNGWVDLPAWLGFAASSRTFAGTPPVGSLGDHALRVTAHAANGASSSLAFNLTVTATAPIYHGSIPSALSADATRPFSYTVPAGAFTESDGTTLTYSVDGRPVWLNFDAATHTLSGTAPTSEIGQNFTLTFRATNPQGQSAQATASLAVQAYQQPAPIYHGTLTDHNGEIGGSALVLPLPSGAFTEPDGGALTYSAEVLIPQHDLDYPINNGTDVGTRTVAAQWVSLSQVGLAINATTGTISGTPTTLDFLISEVTGTYRHDLGYTIGITATNAQGGQAAGLFTLDNTVAALAVGHPIANRSVAPGQGWLGIVAADTFTDPYGAGLTYSARLTSGAALPAGLTWSGSSLDVTRVISGSYAIQVTATDGLGRPVSTGFTLTVSDAAPVFSAMPANQSATQLKAMSYVAPAATDANGDAITYSASNLPPGVSFNASTHTFSGTPTSHGSWTVTYTASAHGLSVQTSFTLTVAAAQLPPVYGGGLTTQHGVIGEAFSYTPPTGSFSSPGGQALSYSAEVLIPQHDLDYPINNGTDIGTRTVAAQWVSLSQVGLAINATTGTISGTVKTLDYLISQVTNTYQRDASYAVRLLATNAYGSISGQFTLGNTFQAPQLAKTLPALTVNPGQGSVLAVPAGSFTDPSGQGLTYSASGLPAGVTFSGSSLVIGKAAAGSHTITLTAKARDGQTASGTFTLTVNNAAPVWSGSLVNHTGTVGKAITAFTGPAASDANGDAITYSASGLPPGVSFNASTRSFSGTPTTAGNHTVTYKATDSHGASVSKTFTFNISAAYAPPAYNGGIPSTVDFYSGHLSYTVPGTAFSSPTGLALSYSATLTGGTSMPVFVSFNASTRTFTATQALAERTASVTLVARDSTGHSASVTFTVDVLGTRMSMMLASADGSSIDGTSLDPSAPATTPADDANDASATFPGQGQGHAYGRPAWAGQGTGPNGAAPPADDASAAADASTASNAPAPAPTQTLLATTDPGTGGDTSPGGTPSLGGDTGTSTTPNVQSYWFTYDEDNRVVIQNGALTNGAVRLQAARGSLENIYDGAGNVTAVLTLDDSQVSHIQSYAYDERNELVQTRWQTVLGQADKGVQETRSFDAAGHLLATDQYYQNGTIVSYDLTAGEPEPLDISGWLRIATVNHYDADGRMGESDSYARPRSAWYQAANNAIQAGRVTVSQEKDPGSSGYGLLGLSSQVLYSDASGHSGYDAAGLTRTYRYAYYNSSNLWTTDTYTVSYLKQDSYLKQATAGRSSDTSKVTATTTSLYDVFGERLAIETQFSASSYDHQVRAFAFNGNGQILQRSDGSAKDGVFTLPDTPNPQYYAYANGQQVAHLGGDGMIDVLAGLTAFSNDETGTSDYVVQAGDTLRGIAQQAYGDANLWYVVADANALNSDTDLTPGQSLKLPQVTTHSNGADTFKPYDPAKISGSTTPSLPQAPPPPAHCNAVAMVIVIAVIVVATILTAGAAAVAMGAAGGSLGAVFGAGAAALAGTSSIGVAAAMGAAFVGGFVGTAAGELAGQALGVHGAFSLREAFAGGVTSAITAGIGGELSNSGMFGKAADAASNTEEAATTATTTSQALKVAGTTGRELNTLGGYAMGAASYAGGVVGHRLAHMPTQFSWAGVVASSVASGLTSEIGLKSEEQERIGNGTHSFTADVLSGYVSGGLRRELSIGLGDHRVASWESIGEDAFGNALANSVVGYNVRREQAREQLQSTEASLLHNEQVRVNADIDVQLQGTVAGDMDALRMQAQDQVDAQFNRLDAGLQAGLDEQAYRNLGSGAWARSEGSPAPDVQFEAPMIDGVTITPHGVYYEGGDSFSGGMSTGESVKLRMDGARVRQQRLLDAWAAQARRAGFEKFKQRDGMMAASVFGAGALSAPLTAAAILSPEIAVGLGAFGVGDGVKNLLEGLNEKNNYKAVMGSLEMAGGAFGLKAGISASGASVEAKFAIVPDKAILDEITALTPGARPDPATYLSSEYIDSHLSQFNEGASYLTPKAALDRWGREMLGREDGQFVMPSAQVDDLLLKTNGDLASIEAELGITPGDWQGREFVRIDINDPRSLNLRMATGNEEGANPLWISGGKMPTGYSEAVTDPIPTGSYTETSIFNALNHLRKTP